MVVVISFLFVLGTKVRMQPVVMAPKYMYIHIYSNDLLVVTYSTFDMFRVCSVRDMGRCDVFVL